VVRTDSFGSGLFKPKKSFNHSIIAFIISPII
jgi:hypothetical protein